MIGEDEANIDQWRQFWLKTADSQKKHKKKKDPKTNTKNKKLLEPKKYILYTYISTNGPTWGKSYHQRRRPVGRQCGYKTS